MKSPILLIGVLFLGWLVWIAPATPTQAQTDLNLSQTFAWDELDLTLDYPDTWYEAPIVDEGVAVLVSDEALLEDESAIGSRLFLLHIPDTTTYAALDPNDTTAFAEDVLASLVIEDFEDTLSPADFEVESLTTQRGPIPLVYVPTAVVDLYYVLVLFPDDPTQAVWWVLEISDPTQNTDTVALLVAMLDTLRFGDETSPAPTPAPSVPDDGVLVYGESERGTIAAGDDEHLFSFSAEAGDMITISMIADDENALDTYLVLLDANGTLLAENDDADETTFNSQIVYEIIESGDYTIVAMQYNGTGDYTITLTAVGAVSAPPPDGPNSGTIISFENTISIGDSINGAFSAQNNQHILYFAGDADQTITISFAPTNGATSQYLLDVFDADIISRTSGPNDTLIIEARLLAGGSYGVYVLSLNPQTANAYTLSITP